MNFTNILFAGIVWFCSLIFGIVALWAFKRRDPMHFWSGSEIKPEEITDIPAYNRANGFMWTIYTVCMVVTGTISLFNIWIGVGLVGIICVPGSIGLIFAYKQIYNKYKRKNIVLIAQSKK